MKKKIMYILILIVICLTSYYHMLSFAERYRLNAAELFSLQAITQELYDDLLETLQITKNNAPPLVQNSSEVEKNVFKIYRPDARYRAHAASFDTLVAIITQKGASVYSSFVGHTLFFALSVVAISLIIAILTEYFNRLKLLTLIPQLIESIPVILILLWAHFHINSSVGWYAGIAAVMIPVSYRPYVGWIKDLKKNNIIYGERMYAETERKIIVKLLLHRWPLMISQCFFFMAMALMIDSCMNFIAPFDFGDPTLSSCLGRVMEWSDKDLGILNELVHQLKCEFFWLYLLFIGFFIICQQLVLLFDYSARKK